MHSLTEKRWPKDGKAYGFKFTDFCSVRKTTIRSLALSDSDFESPVATFYVDIVGHGVLAILPKKNKKAVASKPIFGVSQLVKYSTFYRYRGRLIKK